jgi:hypothetical protein
MTSDLKKIIIIALLLLHILEKHITISLKIEIKIKRLELKQTLNFQIPSITD